MNPSDYWKECILAAADECGLSLTDEQAEYLADAVEAENERLAKKCDNLDAQNMRYLKHVGGENDRLTKEVAALTSRLAEREKVEAEAAHALNWARRVIEQSLGESIRNASKDGFDRLIAALQALTPSPQPEPL